jgi:hypothetical protein
VDATVGAAPPGEAAAALPLPAMEPYPGSRRIEYWAKKRFVFNTAIGDAGGHFGCNNDSILWVFWGNQILR